MNRKNGNSQTGIMIQRCHRWRQKRKNYLDQARQTADEIERERLLQMAEHYGRIVSDEQGKIDSKRDNGKKPEACEIEPKEDEEDDSFQDFKSQL
ncbi:MAG: hypothetical protein FWC83_00700 [Alphaproteobacteria bacterium]|nr:hypothetical protein [Alphaproteobacteria bacterium]